MSLTTVLTAAAALLAVVLLAVLAGRAARATGLGKRAAGARLHLEESLALDARRRLLLVRCDGRQVLLLTGPQDRVVGWLDEPGRTVP
jgi:flagellar protein FliO/FliZ